MEGRREGKAPIFDSLQLGWVPITPAKPDSERQPESSNWQYNSPVNETNLFEPGLMSSISQVTQPNWSIPEEFIAQATTQTALGQYSSINTWRGDEGSSSHVYGAGLAEDDKFTIDDAGCWNNFSFGSLLAMAHSIPPNDAPNAVMQADSAATTNVTFGTQFCPLVAASQRTLTFEDSSVPNIARNILSNVAPNVLVQADSAATNFTFGTQFRPLVTASQLPMTFESSLVSNVAHDIPTNVAPNALTQVDSAATNFTFGTQFPHVAASQCMLNFGDSSVPNLDNFLEDNSMCQLLGVGGSRPLFDLNSPCTTVAEDAALCESISIQFEPITQYETNRAEYKQDGPSMKTYGKKLARDGQENKTRDEKKQSVVDQLPRRVHENHKPDKGGPNEADLTKTPQQQKPRRRKHRPKVVIEGQVKATAKPRKTLPSASRETVAKRKYVRRKATISSSEKQKNEDGSNIEASTCNDTPTGKRRYTRRKLINESESTADKEFSEPTHISTNRLTRNSCRRSLNFNLEPQSEKLDAKDDKSRSLNRSHDTEVMEQNLNEMGGPYDLTSSMKQTPEGYLPRPDKGKCKIVFSDVTHDKEVNIQLMANNDKQWTPPDNSICSNLTRETERGLKRQHSEVEASSSNFMEKYLSMFSQHDCVSGMLFPTIHKKKRTQRTSRTNYGSSVAAKATNLLMNNNIADDTGSGSQNFEDLLDFEPTACVKRKRSKGCTRVRNFASLQELCKKLPAIPSEATKASQTKYEIGAPNEPLTCMEALVAFTCSTTVVTKKRSKRTFVLNTRVQNIFNEQEFASTSAGPPLALKWRSLSEIDLITNQLNLLDLNAARTSAQMQLALMPNRMHYEQKHALVPYQRGGAIVPFEQVQRRQARPRVDLDEETAKVWKLLLEDINSEGVDGTDDEKTKWWEEERRVFKGRADSFIARMHLIQGDRRFSPWKGSVVDSVVGVFLTQNVSDHLSSSAFITLAAHFPPVSKTSAAAECFEEKVYSEPKQPEASILNTDETTALNKKVLFEPVNSSDCQMLNDFDGDEIKEDNLSGQLPADGNTDSVPFQESVPNKSTGVVGDVLELDDILCSQIPVISSQSSADSPDTQTSEITGSCSLSNSKEEPENSFASSTYFVKLLQMAGTVLQGGYENDGGNKDLDKIQKVQSESLALKSDNLQHSVSSSETTCETGAKEANNGNKIQMKQGLVEKPTAEVEAQCSLQDGGHKKQEVPVADIRPHHLNDSSGSSNNVGNSRKSDHKEVSSNKIDPDYQPGKTTRKGGRIRKGKQHPIDWDSLRSKAEEGGRKRERTANTMDSVDWDAVRCAKVTEIAEIIKERGMNNMLAERIKDFLNRIVKDHGSIDLEWLRDVPPDKAKEYLLSFRGLGLKSVECVRLLTLHHLAFPVDTNVGRIAVRLGWVPLQPLPESLQLHLLEMYPILESIQKFLWPRLCKLDQRTLYELHYQMITFGKVFCTKSKPNCNACPMRGECRHFASAFASARLALPAPEEKRIVVAGENKATDQDPMRGINTLQLPSPFPVPVEKRIVTTEEQAASQNLQFHSCQPIIDEPATPEPIIEFPTTPETECDIEDAFDEDPDEIPTIHFNMQQFTQNLQDVMQNTEIQEGDMSKALIALTAEAASIPVPKLKNVSRLRTEHQVYELSDSHPLLEGMDKREPDDPSPYLLAIWTPGETVNSIEPPERRCGSRELGKLCNDETCLSCNSIREQNSQTVRGTLLIPCRTAMRGSFPLNGTYFQVNEVFSDHESSLNPIDVPRKWLWNLPRRTVYFGTSVTSIFRGLTTAGVQHCFWRGFICVRGFDRKMRAPRPVIARLHFPVSKTRGKGKTDVDED